ncbi:Mitochondrial inner membrane protein OXA1-like, partial [Sesamum alatum]
MATSENLETLNHENNTYTEAKNVENQEGYRNDSNSGRNSVWALNDAIQTRPPGSSLFPVSLYLQQHILQLLPISFTGLQLKQQEARLMAYRRSITARAKLLYQQHRVAPSFSHIPRDDDDHGTPLHHSTISKNPEIPSYFQHRFFGTGNNVGFFHRSRNLFQDRRFGIPAACGPVFVRNMSSLGEGPAEKIEIMTDVLGDKAVEVASQVGPVVNEVTVAAADSFFPVAALQYLIDYIHSFTGFNWWASIVLATLLIRGIQLPIMINQLKSTSKFT